MRATQSLRDIFLYQYVSMCFGSGKKQTRTKKYDWDDSGSDSCLNLDPRGCDAAFNNGNIMASNIPYFEKIDDGLSLSKNVFQ